MGSIEYFMWMKPDKSAHLIVNQTCKISAAPEFVGFFYAAVFPGHNEQDCL